MLWYREKIKQSKDMGRGMLGRRERVWYLDEVVSLTEVRFR